MPSSFLRLGSYLDVVLSPRAFFLFFSVIEDRSLKLTRTLILLPYGTTNKFFCKQASGGGGIYPKILLTTTMILNSWTMFFWLEHFYSFSYHSKSFTILNFFLLMTTCNICFKVNVKFYSSWFPSKIEPHIECSNMFIVIVKEVRDALCKNYSHEWKWCVYTPYKELFNIKQAGQSF